MAEIEYLCEHFHPDHLWFCDDILGLKPGWIRRFADLAEERHCRIPFSCQTRVDLMLQEDNVRHIARAGARTVWVGAESGSQAVLDAMEKGTTVTQIHEATSSLQRAGVDGRRCQARERGTGGGRRDLFQESPSRRIEMFG